MSKSLLIVTLSSAALMALLSGCELLGPVCTEEARASVQVTLEDDGGNFPNGVSVTYEPAGEEERPCDFAGTSGEAVCGYEVDGEITVRATAPGYGPAEETVTVGRTEDDCHVVTELVTLVLPAYDG